MGVETLLQLGRGPRGAVLGHPTTSKYCVVVGTCRAPSGSKAFPVELHCLPLCPTASCPGCCLALPAAADMQAAAVPPAGQAVEAAAEAQHVPPPISRSSAAVPNLYSRVHSVRDAYAEVVHGPARELEEMWRVCVMLPGHVFSGSAAACKYMAQQQHTRGTCHPPATSPPAAVPQARGSACAPVPRRHPARCAHCCAGWHATKLPPAHSQPPRPKALGPQSPPAMRPPCGAAAGEGAAADQKTLTTAA